MSNFYINLKNGLNRLIYDMEKTLLFVCKKS